MESEIQPEITLTKTNAEKGLKCFFSLIKRSTAESEDLPWFVVSEVQILNHLLRIKQWRVWKKKKNYDYLWFGIDQYDMRKMFERVIPRIL